MGRLRINKVYKWEFASGKENAEDWVCYCSETEEERRKRPGCLWKDWEKQEVSAQKYVSITIPLKLTGGISVNSKRSTDHDRPEEADFEQLTIQQIFENGEEKQSVPVIPGTSWAGAVRSRTKKLLKDLNCSEEAAERMINGWFGHVDVKAGKDKKTAQQSMIVIGESVLKNSVPLVTTRNKINRFSAATVDGALYTEKAYFGGETQLEIKIRKDKENCYQLLAAMLSFVAADIVRGYLSVGGQTAIGRGIFEGNGPVTGTISEQDMELYKKQLASMIQEGVC
ncbi:MAG: RAMP superfamily CRISPR-associated protein [Lachnospira sp.]